MSLDMFPDEIIMHIMKYLIEYELADFGALNNRMHGIFMEIMKHNYNYVKRVKIIKSYLDIMNTVTELFIDFIKEYKEILSIDTNYKVTYYVYSKIVYINCSDDGRHLSNITIYPKYYNSYLRMYGGNYWPSNNDTDIRPRYLVIHDCPDEHRIKACELLSTLHDIYHKYKNVMLGFEEICREYDYNIYLSITGETYPFDIFY